MNHRIISVMVCICMLLGCAAFPAAAEYDLQSGVFAVNGPTNLLKPLDGSYTKVKYELADSENAAVTGAVWSTNSENLFMTDDGCVILSSTVPNGSYTLSADYGGAVYKKTVQISDGMYNDFNSGTPGEQFTTGSRSSTYYDKGDGDIYVAPDGSFFYMSGIISNIRQATDKVTFEYDTKNDSSDWVGAMGHIQTLCGEWAGNIDTKVENGKYVFRVPDYTDYFTNGKNADIKTYTSDIDGGTWVSITMKMKSQGYDADGKLKDHKWDCYINGELVFPDIILRPIGYERSNGSTIPDCTGIVSAFSYSPIDNAAIYSGDKFDIDEDPYIGTYIDGEKILGKPRTSEPVKSGYALKNFLGNSVDCTWKIEPSDGGVSVDTDGTVTVTRGASAGDYVLTASWPSGEKTFDITVESIDYTLKIDGADKIDIDYGFTEKTYTYTCADQYGISEDCDWTVSGDGSFVTVSGGILTVRSGAPDGEYTLTATPKDKESGLEPAQKKITVRNIPYELKISGRDTLAFKSESETIIETYTAEVICSDDNTVAEKADPSKVKWSITPKDENISIENGTLTVGGAVKKQTYKLTAEYGKYIASKNIVTDGVVYSIRGTTNVVKPQTSMISAVCYSFENNFGEKVTDGVAWSCEGADILSDGRVLVTPNTGAYTVSAEFGGKTYTLAVSVKSGITFDYESYSVGSFADADKKYGEILRSDTKGNKSKYIYIPYTDSSHRMYIKPGLAGSGKDMVMSYDCFAEPGEKYNGSPVLCDTQWMESVTYECALVGGKYVYTFTVEDYGEEPDEGKPECSYPTYKLTLDENEWVHVEIVFDADGNSGFDMYLNGEKAFENIRMRYWNQRDFQIYNILLVGRFDNISSHSGREYERKIKYTGTEFMPVSESGKSEKTLEYVITDEGVENTDLKAKWQITEFGDDFVGNKSDVTINGDKLVVGSYASGTVYVKAVLDDSGINTGDIPIRLSKAFSSLSADNVIGVKGKRGDKFTLKVYNPSEGNFIDSAIRCESTPSVTETLTADESGNASFKIETAKDGLYHITVTDKSGAEEDYTLSVNCENIFECENAKELLTDDEIYDYFKMYTEKDPQLIKKCNEIFKNADDADKDRIIKFTDKNTDLYFAASLLTAVLRGSSDLTDTCCSYISSLGFDDGAVKLYDSNKYKSEISEFVFENSDSAESVLANIRIKTVLIGVEKYEATYKETKPYLAQAGSERYNKASDSEKDAIAYAVSGKKYPSIAALVKAIDSVVLSDTGSGGSGGSGGGSSSGGKKTSSGSMGTYVPTPDTKDRFTDVSKSHWAFEYIENLAEKNIINGYNNYFYPDNVITRAEFVKILAGAFGIEKASAASFSDVSDSDWFMPYVGGAANAGLVLGSDGKFNPNDSITREDACVMIHRFAKHAGISLSGAEAVDFADGNDISAYASEAVGALTSSGIINGVGGGMFAPKASTTRAAAAKIIYMILVKGGMA